QGLLQVLFGCHVEPVLLWGGGAAEADDLSGSGDDLGYLSDALVAGANLAVGVRPQLAAADPVGVAAEPVVGDASAVGLAVGHQLERDFVLLVSPRQDLGDGLDLLVGERRHVGAVGVPVGEPGAVVGVLDGDDPVVAVQVRGRAVLGVPRLPDGPAAGRREVRGMRRRVSDDGVDADDVVALHLVAWAVLAAPLGARHACHAAASSGLSKPRDAGVGSSELGLGSAASSSSRCAGLPGRLPRVAWVADDPKVLVTVIVVISDVVDCAVRAGALRAVREADLAAVSVASADSLHDGWPVAG